MIELLRLVLVVVFVALGVRIRRAEGPYRRRAVDRLSRLRARGRGRGGRAAVGRLAVHEPHHRGGAGARRLAGVPHGALRPRRRRPRMAARPVHVHARLRLDPPVLAGAGARPALPRRSAGARWPSCSRARRRAGSGWPRADGWDRERVLGAFGAPYWLLLPRQSDVPADAVAGTARLLVVLASRGAAGRRRRRRAGSSRSTGGDERMAHGPGITCSSVPRIRCASSPRAPSSACRRSGSCSRGRTCPDLARWPEEFWILAGRFLPLRFGMGLLPPAAEQALFVVLHGDAPRRRFSALRPRAACLASAALLYHFAPFEEAIAGLPHTAFGGLTVPVLGLFVLGLRRGSAPAARAVIRRRAGPSPSSSSCSRSATSSPPWPSCASPGLSWFTAENIRYYALGNATVTGAPLALWVAARPAACAAIAGFTFLLELLSPLVVASARFAMAFVLAALASTPASCSSSATSSRACRCSCSSSTGTPSGAALDRWRG